MQVLHSSPELGGDAVQEPSEGAPGIYVGMTPTDQTSDIDVSYSHEHQYQHAPPSFCSLDAQAIY